MNIDSQINTYFKPVAETFASVVFYSVPVGGGHELKLILVWLVLAALFFTFYLGFINLRYFGHAIDIVRGKYDKGDKVDGQISPFQALMTSMAATVGLGNIAGVAIAVSVGGPGAALWMAILGFFGMSVKFAEVMCGIKYRHHPDPDNPGEIYGGPMYYLRDVFANLNISYVGNTLAWLYALCAMLGALGAVAMFQTNQTYQQILNVSGGSEALWRTRMDVWRFHGADYGVGDCRRH